MRYKTKDKCTEYVYELAEPGEVFIEITPDMVDGIYDYYQISNFGRVYHNYLKIFMKYGKSKDGYYSVGLSTIHGTKQMRVHRLVLIAFKDIPNRDQYQVNHINGDKSCNYLSNLEWVTPSDNMLHAYKIGLHGVGENNVHSKVDNYTAEIICKLIEDGFENKQIAEVVNTTISVVQDIRSGHGYKFISKNYNFNRRPGKLFDDEQIHCICNYFETHPKGDLTVNDHCRNALLYNDYIVSEKSVDTIRKVYIRKYYKNISKDYYF